MWHAADDFVVNDGDFLNENWLFFNIVKIKVDAFMWLNHIKFISTWRKYQQNYGRLAIKRSSMCCQLWCVLKRSFRTGIFKNSLWVKIKAIFHYSNSVHVWILLFLSLSFSLSLWNFALLISCLHLFLENAHLRRTVSMCVNLGRNARRDRRVSAQWRYGLTVLCDVRTSKKGTKRARNDWITRHAHGSVICDLVFSPVADAVANNK